MRKLIARLSLALVVPWVLTAQISARPPRVEIVSPAAPVAVLADGKRVLAYELHVTNLGRGALAFRRIEIRDAASPSTPIAVYGDSGMLTLLQPVGRPEVNVARLDPGQRTVVYLWLASEPTVETPRRLRHWLLFENMDTADARRDGGTQAVIDNIDVTVSHAQALLLRAPFGGGEWLAGSGPSNTSDHRRSLNAVDARAYISQRFATDWVRIGPNGNTYQGDEHRNESYWAFGQPVRAVAVGEVVAAVDSVEDHSPHGPIPPVTLANIMGNFVTIRVGPSRYVTYAHLRRGSVHVRLHQRVMVGTIIGSVGNTGQSTAPHLHFQVTDKAAVLASEGIPYVFDRFNFLGTANDFDEAKHVDVARRNELPTENMVVRFPNSR